MNPWTHVALGVVAVILIGGTGLAAQSYRVNSSTVQLIVEWGSARNITNNVGKDLFIPTNTSAEWTSFINYPPAGVTLVTVKTIVISGSGRRWSDATYATTCKQYKNPSAGYAYAGDTGDGIYTIDPDGGGAGAPYDAYCNMGFQNGGWTRCAAERLYYSSGESKTITHGFLSEVKNLSLTLNDSNPLSRNGITVIKAGRASGANIEDKCGPSSSFAPTEVMIMERERVNNGYGPSDNTYYYILKSPETWPFSRSTSTAQADCYSSGAYVNNKWDKYSSSYTLLGTAWSTVNWLAGDGRQEAPTYCVYFQAIGQAIVYITGGQLRWVFGERPGSSSWGMTLNQCIGCAGDNNINVEASAYAADESNKASLYNTFTVGTSFTYYKHVKEFYVR